MRTASGKRRNIAVALALAVTLVGACSWDTSGEGDEEVWGPEGEFVSVSAGSAHTCGLKTDGSVACWGREPYDLLT